MLDDVAFYSDNSTAYEIYAERLRELLPSWCSESVIVVAMWTIICIVLAILFVLAAFFAFLIYSVMKILDSEDDHWWADESEGDGRGGPSNLNS